MKKAIILSDKKPGHVNQSVALAKILNFDYDIYEVEFKCKFYQFLSYIFDFFEIHKKNLLIINEIISNYELIISAGSSTYYANKYLSKKLKLKNIAVLLPRGYKLNFYKIICPKYDKPSNKKNIIKIDANISFSEPLWFKSNIESFLSIHTKLKPAIGIIVGGDSSFGKIDTEEFEKQLKHIFNITKGYERWITTSRRTPLEIEKLINNHKFDYKLIYRTKKYNPVPAFTQLCDFLFITADSSSMISEAVSTGNSSVTIIPIKKNKLFSKFDKFINNLLLSNCLNILSEKLMISNNKINTEKKIIDIF